MRARVLGFTSWRRVMLGALFTAAITAACTVEDRAKVENVGQAQQALSTTLKLKLPDGMSPSGFALAASGTLSVNDRAFVSGLVINTGNGATSVGVDGRTGPLTSVAQVTLRDRARVAGDLLTTTTVIRQNGTVIDGGLFQSESLPSTDRTLVFDFGSGSGGAVSVLVGQTRVLAPGSYGALSVQTGGTLKLSAGRYFGSDLLVEPNARVEVDTSLGPVYIFVRNSVILRGVVGSSVRPDPALLIAYAGTAVFQVDAPFSGVILAPNAKLNLQTGGPFVGQAFAKDIELHQGLRWTGKASSFWSRLLTPLPTTPLTQTDSETLADILPNNAVGSAIRSYVSASFASTSASARATALNSLKAQPVADVVAALRGGFDATTDFSSRAALINSATALSNGAALPFFTDLLTRPVPDLSLTQGHDHVLARNGRLLLAAVAGVEALVKAGFTPARTALVDAAVNHPLVLVRRTSIFRIVRSGDGSLRAALEARISTKDRRFLALHPLSTADLTGVAGVNNPPTEEPPRSTQPGSSTPQGGGQSPDTNDSGGTGGTSGSGGTGGGGPTCNEQTAVDLGSDGHNVIVSNNGCLRVRDAYPSWWQVRTMKLESVATGVYPVPFTWTNTCTGSSGSGTFSEDWQSFLLTSTGSQCATVIDLRGAGNGNVTLRYWAQ